jgi:hypothetical protein
VTGRVSEKNKEESSFSEEKESKRLFSVGGSTASCERYWNKSFLLLFFKKEALP